jgi:tetratricopeptide (TPR) repeat protein
VILALVLSLTARAHADEPEALRLRKKALQSYQEGKYAQAAREFRAAHALDPDPEMLYALGQALRLAGDCAGAIQAYQAFLEGAERPDQKSAAREKIEFCRAQLPAEPDPASQPAAAVEPSAQATAEPARDRVDRPSPWYTDVIGGVLVGSGVVAAATGTWLIASGRATIDRVDRADTEQEFLDARAEVPGARRRYYAGIGLAGAGAGLVAAGVLRYILRARAPETVAASAVEGGGASLFVTGTF